VTDSLPNLTCSRAYDLNDLIFGGAKSVTRDSQGLPRFLHYNFRNFTGFLFGGIKRALGLSGG
jgi:hypothetical protein